MKEHIKKSSYSALVFIFCFKVGICQTLPDINGQLHTLFSVLTKPTNSPNSTACYSKFLWDMAANVSTDYPATLGINNPGPAFDWYTQYSEFYHRSYTLNYLPRTTIQLKNAANELFRTERVVPMGIMDFSYYEFINSSFNIKGQYFDWTDFVISDVVGRSSEPYKTTVSGDYNLIFFKAAPLIDKHKYRSVIYRFDPQFILYGIQYSCYFEPYPQNELQVDLGDGGGWRTINLTSGIVNIPTIYPQKGTYTINYRVLEDGNTKRTCSSSIEILTDDLPVVADELLSLPGLDISVYYPCSLYINSKPLIYVSGIDLFESKNKYDLYEEYILRGNLDNLRQQGFKIYVVDWENSRKDLRTSSQELISLIKHLNLEMENNLNPNQIVIIGSSIGGVIGRYALTKMEQDGENHNTRLLVTLDSPHQGANFPIGMQHLYNLVASPQFIAFQNHPILFDIFPYVDLINISELYLDMLDKTGVKQMLTYHMQARTTYFEYPSLAERNDFVSSLYSLNPLTNGYPTQCKVVLISDGLIDGTRQSRTNGEPAGGNDVLLGYGLAVNVNIFKNFNIPVVDLSMTVYTTPDGYYQILAVPVILKSLVIIGCLNNILNNLTSPGNFLSAVASCIQTVTSNANEFAYDTKDIDAMSGGTAYNFRETPPGGGSKWYSGISDPIMSGDRGIGFHFGWLSGYGGILIENPTPCFVTMKSALDIGGPMDFNNIYHANLTQMSVADIVATPGPAVLKGAGGNWVHNEWGPPTNPSNNTPVLVTGFVKPQEINVTDMRLENIILKRRAFYEAEKTIVAGQKVYEFDYTYPSSLADFTKPLSKENGFVVNVVPLEPTFPPGWDYVTFKAGKKINLKPGFTATLGARFHAYIFESSGCTAPLGKQGSKNSASNIQKWELQKEVKKISSEEQNNNPEIIIYPQPSKDELWIQINNADINNENISITLISFNGKEMPLRFTNENATTTSAVLHFDLRNLQLLAQVFALKINFAGTNYYRKIVLVK